jgi:hypothetical protein
MRKARVSGPHVSQESGNRWSVGWSVGREAREETKGQGNWPQAGTQRFKGKPVNGVWLTMDFGGGMCEVGRGRAVERAVLGQLDSTLKIGIDRGNRLVSFTICWSSTGSDSWLRLRPQPWGVQ